MLSPLPAQTLTTLTSPVGGDSRFLNELSLYTFSRAVLKTSMLRTIPA